MAIGAQAQAGLAAAGPYGWAVLAADSVAGALTPQEAKPGIATGGNASTGAFNVAFGSGAATSTDTQSSSAIPAWLIPAGLGIVALVALAWIRK